MDILEPKQLDTEPGEAIVGWARRQLEIARDIIDNPGGGLLFGSQTIGQVKTSLRERDEDRWAAVIARLDAAEDEAVRRDFAAARKLIDEALGGLS